MIRRLLPYLVASVIGAIMALVGARLYVARLNTPNPEALRRMIDALDRPASPSAPSDSPIIRAAARIQPTVVNIDTLEEARGGADPAQGRREARASGVIISSDGFIVTNYHVVQGASIIRITMDDGRRMDGRLFGWDADADLAVVRVQATGLPAAVLGDSDALKVGESVIAVGNPLGIGITVTHGIVSAINRNELHVGGGRFLHHAIQTDAPINRGNSGGALANTRGELIGINTAILSDSGSNIGIGFAIPVNSARSVLKRIATKPSAGSEAPVEPFLGVRFTAIPPQFANELGLKPGVGVIVIDVKPLTPADDAGIRVGAIIVSIEGKLITQQDMIRKVLATKKPGDRIRLGLVRGDRSVRDSVLTLGIRPSGDLGR